MIAGGIARRGGRSFRHDSNIRFKLFASQAGRADMSDFLETNGEAGTPNVVG